MVTASGTRLLIREFHLNGIAFRLSLYLLTICRPLYFSLAIQSVRALIRIMKCPLRFWL